MNLSSLYSFQYSFKTSFFLKIMNSIQSGHLTITLPDGSVREFLGKNPGIKANLLVKDYQAIAKIISASDIGLAESYRDGLIESSCMTSLILLCIENQKAIDAMFKGNFFGMIYYRLRHHFRFNSRKGSQKNIAAHYDLGNNFYQLWLDKSMTYSSALFKHAAESLESAQINKHQRIIDTLNFNSTDHVLEIGGGWGAFAIMAATQRGCKVTCLTLSKEQFSHASSKVMHLGLAHLISIKICDYRDEKGSYDYIVSIEMIEAVGEQYWGAYFQTITDRLKTGGKAMIQSIYILDELFDSYRKSTDFIQQFMFPGGMLPSPKIFKEYSRKYNLIMHDFFEFGPDYARTLNFWRKEFYNKYVAVKDIGFDDKFLKIWSFYYSYCEAAFISRRIDVAQIVLEKK